MTATDTDRLLALRLERRFSQPVSTADARTLRLAERTLHRWAELECGDSDAYSSWMIERDDATGKPFHVYHHGDGRVTRTPIPDREAGALRRVAALCTARGWSFYQQTDPRGCALYVAIEPLTNTNYTNGIAVSV